MNGCNEMQARFSEYLDGCLNGREMQQIAAHLDACPECAGEWESLRQTQRALAELGPVPEPKDLLLRIRVAVSQERARSRQSILSVWSPGLEKHRRPVSPSCFCGPCQRGSAARHRHAARHYVHPA